MKVLPNEYANGPMGIAALRISKKTITVIMDDGGDQFQFDAEKVKLPKGVNAGKWHVFISADGTELRSVRPPSGSFVVKFANIASRKDSPPVPKTKNGLGTKKDGGTYPINEQTFTAMLEISEGPLSGTQFPLKLLYKDLKWGSGFALGAEGMTVLKGNLETNKRLKKTADFIELSTGAS